MSKNALLIFPEPNVTSSNASFVQITAQYTDPHLLEMTQRSNKPSHLRGYTSDSFYFFNYKMTETINGFSK